MNQRLGSLIIFLALPLISLLNGCGKPLPYPPDVNTVASAFDLSVEQREEGKFPPALRIYLDFSGSMAGFADESGTSTYIRTLRSIWTRAITSGGNVAAYDLSKLQNANLPGDFIRISSPVDYACNVNSYKGGTPLIRLFNSISGQNNAALIISDLVLPDEEGDEVALVNAFRKLIDKFPYIRIMAFRSKFKGAYFVENPARSESLYQVNVPDGKGGRPFYILIAATNLKSFETLDNYILKDLNPDFIFEPHNPPLKIYSMAVASDIYQDSDIAPWGDMEFYQDLNSVVQRFQIQDIKSRPHFKFELQAQMQAGLTLSNEGKIRSEVRRITSISDPANSSPESIQIPVTLTKQPESDLFLLEYNLDVPLDGTWDIYHIRMTGGKANVMTPAWVNQWSTHDDRNPSQATRTLHLDLLLLSMIRAITEEEPILNQIIYLGRGR